MTMMTRIDTLDDNDDMYWQRVTTMTGVCDLGDNDDMYW